MATRGWSWSINPPACGQDLGQLNLGSHHTKLIDQVTVSHEFTHLGIPLIKMCRVLGICQVLY